MGNDMDLEKKIDKLPQPATINTTETILRQMRKSICKIYREKPIQIKEETKEGEFMNEIEGGEGTGFFCDIPYNNLKLRVLLTNYHVLDKYIKEYQKIHITMNDGKINKIIHLNNNINQFLYFSEKYDITIIPVMDLDDIESLILDPDIFETNGKTLFRNKTIYNISYPNGNKSFVSYGLLKDFDDFKIKHFCSTEKGSSGSPIINLSNNKVIGIHTAGSTRFDFNYGTFLKYAIKEFIERLYNMNFYKFINNKYNHYNNNTINNKNSNNDYNKQLTMSINTSKFENNIQNISSSNSFHNKKIMNISLGNISNNTDYFYKNKMSFNNKVKRHSPDSYAKNENLIKLTLNVQEKDLNKKVFFLNYSYHKKNINNSNIELFINDKKFEYHNYIIPKNIGIYRITLKFKNDITDCSCMFLSCENIINIDLSSFNSKNVINMANMFENCYNLNNINFSSLNTENVIDMKNMFCNCRNLNILNLSSFNTCKVMNMHEMFYRCCNLIKLDLSSFKTPNVVDMKLIFGECYKLKNLICFDERIINEFYLKLV